MKSFFNILLALTIVACSVSALFSSCVRPEYELSEDNLNLDMTLFQEGIVFPLGNTVSFTLGELYDKYGQALEDYFKHKSKSDALIDFGKDSQVGFALTAEELPQLVTEQIVSGGVGLGGNVINGLPFQFELDFQLLDKDGNVIPLKKGAGHQVIRPCALDGTPQTTKLTAIECVTMNVKASDIMAVRLHFVASVVLSADLSEFNEDSFLQTELTAIFPKGISLNWDELSKLTENTEI